MQRLSIKQSKSSRYLHILLWVTLATIKKGETMKDIAKLIIEHPFKTAFLTGVAVDAICTITAIVRGVPYESHAVKITFNNPENK